MSDHCRSCCEFWNLPEEIERPKEGKEIAVLCEGCGECFIGSDGYCVMHLDRKTNKFYRHPKGWSHYDGNKPENEVQENSNAH